MEISEKEIRQLFEAVGMLQGQNIALNYIMMEFATELALTKNDRHKFVSTMFERTMASLESRHSPDQLANPVYSETRWELETFFKLLGQRVI